MADKEIKITFPEEKMEALVFFLGEQNEKVEDVLKTHLDKTYEKSVPAQVRKFVESRIPAAEEESVTERTEACKRTRKEKRQTECETDCTGTDGVCADSAGGCTDQSGRGNSI